VLPGVGAPAQTRKVEVPRISEEVPQLHEEAIRHMTQTKDSDVLPPALRTAGTQIPRQESKLPGWALIVCAILTTCVRFDARILGRAVEYN
jgi:hypothetical protein